ncbi:hypothetical protein DL763_006043 [Monosporascus cannonballus]|nr:hypothetical protein DL763_006043 [Monosporascus cannonballus]
MSEFLANVFKNKDAARYGKEAIKVAASFIGPVARTVEAYEKVIKIGDVTSKAASLLDKTESLIPSLQVVTESACDKVALIARFTMIGSAIGFGVHAVQQYQGNQALKLIAARLQEIGQTLEAQTVLMAQQLFPQYVYDMVQERLDATSGKRESHWIFVYHPDTDWYPGFCKLVSEKRLGRRFCGWSNQLDALFLFMLAVRKELAENPSYERNRHRPVKFHILIPAYQPVIVTDFLSCPAGAGDFVIEGKIHNGQPLVWLNLPAEQEHFLRDVGNWKPPSPGWVDWLMRSLAIRNKASQTRRELGTVPIPDQLHDGVDEEATRASLELQDKAIEETVSRHTKQARRKGVRTHREKREEPGPGLNRKDSIGSTRHHLAEYQASTRAGRTLLGR